MGRTWVADTRGTRVTTRKHTAPPRSRAPDPRWERTTPFIHNTRALAPKREAMEALRLDGLIAAVLESAPVIAAQPKVRAQGLSLRDAPSTPGDPYVWTVDGVLDWGDTVPGDVLESVSQRTDDLPPLLLSEVRALEGM